MIKKALYLLASFIMISSCNPANPLLGESPLPYGAPQFDKIRACHYLPAFEQGIKEAKAEIDAISQNPEAPSFGNTVEALEYAGRTLHRVSGIFFNLLEADSSDELQEIAQKVSPMMTEYSMYVSLNPALFERVKAVYEARESLGLEKDQAKLLEDCYKGFVRGGALLSGDDKAEYSKLSEELSLLNLKFGQNVLSATNAYHLNITDSSKVSGLPSFVLEAAAALAAEKGEQGWTFDLSYPSYSAFMKYSPESELKKQLYVAYNSKSFGGEFDNCGNILSIVEKRLRIANLLGYPSWAAYVVEDRMAKNPDTVSDFLSTLMEPSLAPARKEVADILAFAKENGYTSDRLEPWDFSYWSERYKDAFFSLNDEMLKPYFRLEDCIDGVFGLATRLYGLSFTERHDIPVYHKDVKVYDVKDADGRHMALFYVDFFPRESKRGGAWMTEFRGQSIRDGVEERPLVSIVTNFTKPTPTSPSLLTHYELTTFLHEFGHSLHGMLAEGRYPSQTGTNVSTDFVELPSQIMENWGYEPEYLQGFAKHYQSGEPIPAELIAKVERTRNYLSAYYQVRQLHFGLLDQAWHNRTSAPGQDVAAFEKETLRPFQVLPTLPECCISTSFNHIFSGGYSAGYYSYKWSEVLEADAFSLFKEKGIFNPEVASSFRENILSKGSTEDEAVLYRNFRGRDPEPEALLRKLNIK